MTLAAFFGAAWAIGVASWFFAIVETIGMWRFWPWVYRSGLKIVDESIPNRPVLSQLGAAIDLPSVKGQIESDQEVFFRVPFQLFSFKLHTPFPIKGSVIFSGNSARLVGRVPIGTVAFIATWLVAWTIGGFMAVNTNTTIDTTSFVLGGWAFVAAMVAISLPIELHRIRKARDALLLHLFKAA